HVQARPAARPRGDGPDGPRPRRRRPGGPERHRRRGPPARGGRRAHHRGPRRDGDAGDVMADFHPFDLKSFDAEVQAAADLERLRTEIREAEAARDRIRDQARREGLDLAKADAIEAARRDAAPLADLLRRAAEAVKDRRAELTTLAE